MAGIKNLRENIQSGMKDVVFEKIYEAELSGKPLSQGEVRKMYSKALSQAEKPEEKPEAKPTVSDVDVVGTAKKLARQRGKNGKPQSIPALQQPTNVGTAQQKLDDVQKVYNDYVSSDEYRLKQGERNRTALQEAMDRMFAAPGVSASDMPMNIVSVNPQDDKEKRLRATVDYYEQQVTAEEKQRIIDADLKELESWSDEERAALDRYILDRDQEYYNDLNPMTDKGFGGTAERNAAALINKYGKKRVNEMAESLTWSRNQTLTEDVTEMAQEHATEHPVLSSAATVPINLVSGVSGMVGYAKEASHGTGRFSTMDANNAGNLLNVYSGTVREQVANDIEGGEENTNGWQGKAWAHVYRGGMSAIDSLVRSAGGEAGSLALAATGSFSQTVSNASAQGASPAEAVTLGVIDGGLEILTEKVSLDKLLEDVGGSKNAVDFVKNLLIQGGVEVTEEEASFLGSTLAEAAILQGRSSYNLQIGDLVASGMSYEEAKQTASYSLVKEAWRTGVESFLSGGMMYGATEGGTKAINKFLGAGTQQAQSTPAAPETEQGQVVPAQAETAAVVPAAAGSSTNTVAEMVAKYQSDGHISNRMAEAILADPAAVQQLQEQTGMQLPETKSGKRDAVKAALRQLAGENVPTALSTEGADGLVEDLGQAMWENSPAEQAQALQPAPEVKPEGQQHMENGVAMTLGVEPESAVAQADNSEHGAVGAAEQNFSGKAAYNATLSEDNAQPDRRNDVRPMELPARDVNGGNVSAVTGNVYGSKITPDEFASLMEEPVARGDFTYAKITNDQATQMATETIASAGTWENAYDGWKQSVAKGNAGAEMSARGALLLNHAAQQNNKQQWLETLHYMQKLGTNTAQGLQAFRIIRDLKPVDKIEFVKMSVEKMAAEIKEKHGVDLEIDPALIDKFEQAETDEDRDAVIEEIQQNVANQIPSTFLDKWTALRYMNMLGNLKTNVRNVAGNIGSAAVYRIKDAIAASMEAIASKASGGEFERTKSMFVGKPLLNACKEDFQQIKEIVSSGGKYGDSMSAASQFEQGVQDKRQIFKSNSKNDVIRGVANALYTPIEAYRKGTNWMMNNEYFGDEAFGRAAYSRALAGYLQANGVTDPDLSKVDSNLLDKARAYAVKEAQEATFHDNSALARIVSNVQKATGVVGQGIIPFTKTPANVLTRAEEFSPLGLINSTVTSIQKVRGSEGVSGADVINSWSKTFTGIALFSLGAVMMDQGLLTGGPDEDEEKAAFDELNGQQSYAIQLPDGTNYTIDWLTPAAMPMFMGAQFWKMLSSDRDLTFADMEQVFTSIADPMIQMSMLQGLNDSLDGIKYSDNNLGQFFINAAVSYLTQGLSNTLAGQIERSTEEHRMTTYIDKDSDVPQWLQRQLGKMSQKIPGWDYQQMEYRNAWGQTEENEDGPLGLLYNMLSPGYISKEQSDYVSRELYRLRESTGENVFPQAAEKSFSYTDTSGNTHVNYNLSKGELETMQRVKGQTSAKLLGEIMFSEDYKDMTDSQKAALVADVYSYAQEQAKQAALPNYHSEAPTWMQELKGNEVNGMIQRATLSTLSSAVNNTVDSIESGWTVTPATAQELDTLYDAYDGMSKETKAQILENAISDTAKFLEIRSKGLSTEQYLDVVTDIKALQPESGYTNIRDIQNWEAIAESDILSSKEKDIVMKAYMPDYDPTAKNPQTTELKYDAIRELGVSPQGYTEAYRMYSEASGTGKRRRTISAYMQEFGYDYGTAQKLYDIYDGRYKPWTE